mmetsp:Transcript_45525/g.90192  ORF Transcript_45525/g.90192 Transcript_45525/m.90192 type:complete len:257 (-) Transcript_45525:32-802(-)
MAPDGRPPSWLEALFPRKRSWQSLQCCRLRVDASLGAGLELEEGELGYYVLSVAPEPGQDPALQPGDAILAIEGKPLVGLNPDEDLQQLFGSQFIHDAELLFSRADELYEAVVEHGANEECPCEDEQDPQPGLEAGDDAVGPGIDQLKQVTLIKKQKQQEPKVLDGVQEQLEQVARVRIPIGRTGAAWCLEEQVQTELEADLAILGESFALAARPELGKGGMYGLLLEGPPCAIAAARMEAVQLLQFYRHKLEESA